MKNTLGLFFVFLTILCQAQDPPDITLVFYLDENSEAGTLVGKVSATDPEGDPLTYAIASGNEAGAFSISADEGEITVADQTLMDFETTPIFSLMVEADDGNGGMTTAAITINLNDIIDENPLGLEDEDVLKVFPNPVDHFLKLRYSNSRRIEEIRLYTIGGHQIGLRSYPLGKSEVEVDLRDLRTGIYILSVSTADDKRIQLRIYKN